MQSGTAGPPASQFGMRFNTGPSNGKHGWEDGNRVNLRDWMYLACEYGTKPSGCISHGVSDFGAILKSSSGRCCSLVCSYRISVTCNQNHLSTRRSGVCCSHIPTSRSGIGSAACNKMITSCINHSTTHVLTLLNTFIFKQARHWVATDL